VDAFWSGLLGLRHERDADGDSCLRGSDPEQTIWINAVPEARTVKQRVHLDVSARSLEPILALGATMLRSAAESDALADPEGNEFCVFAP
jgi:hypothetical protein